MYVRWGHDHCPSASTQLVYSGRVGGAEKVVDKIMMYRVQFALSLNVQQSTWFLPGSPVLVDGPGNTTVI